jgi:hypothetical protein
LTDEGQRLKDALKYQQWLRDGILDIVPASEWRDAWNLMFAAHAGLEFGMNYLRTNPCDESAESFLAGLDEARACGLLRDGKGLPSKLENADREIGRLNSLLSKADDKDSDEVKVLRQKLVKLVRHYRRCGEDKLGLEQQIAELGQKPITQGIIQSKVGTDNGFDIRDYDEFEYD